MKLPSTELQSRKRVLKEGRNGKAISADGQYLSSVPTTDERARILCPPRTRTYVAIYRSISTLITEPLAADLNIYRLKRLLRGRF